MKNRKNAATRLLGGLALCALAMFAGVPMTGCTQAQKTNVAQEIVNWVPTLVSAADTVNGLVQAADPATVAILGPITLGINTLAPQVMTAAKNYLANPMQTTLQELQALTTQIQQNTNAALLAAAGIKDPASQAAAIKNINLLASAAQALLALVQSISTPAQAKAMAAHVTVTLAQVRPYLDDARMQAAAERVGRDLELRQAPTVGQFYAYEARAGF
jgi:hypothetical protein